MKPALVAICVVILGFIGDSVKAEIANLNSPLWKEIPGTKLTNASPQYSDPVSVNINSVVRKGDIITYDLVESDASYARVETNCSTRQSRIVRQGFFESASRVNFTSQKSSWSFPNNSYKKTITSFVCKRFK
jgi:hypothetical protein